jgi:hypothetical protein
MIVAMFGAGDPGGSTSDKRPVPGVDEQKISQKRLREALASDLKQSKSNEARGDLAQRLAREALNLTGEPNEVYAYSMEAIDLYVATGDVLAAFGVIDSLAITFDINEVGSKSEILKRVAKESKVVTAKKPLALVALKLTGEALAADQYAIAKEISTLAVSLGKASRDAIVMKRANDLVARTNELTRLYQKVGEARKTLESDGDNRLANEVIGRYLCLARQDWDKGLPYLAKGPESELQAAAKLDLTATEEEVFRSRAADSWWNISEKLKGKDKEIDRQQVMSRVAYWYEQVEQSLMGTEKIQATKRIEAAYDLMSGRNFKKILDQPPNGFLGPTVFDCAETAFEVPIGKQFDIRQSWLLSLQFNPKDLDPGWHQLFYWGDGRIARDPIFIRTDGPSVTCQVEDTVAGHGQGIQAPLPKGLVGTWIDIKMVHDATTREIEVYVNHRLFRKEPLVLMPTADKEMNGMIGGAIDGNPQRFLGKVRNIWMGNIK